MSFLETVEKARAFLERNGRVSLRGLQREFDLDAGALDELIEELVEIQRVAVRDGRALAWAGGVPPAPTETPEHERAPRDYTPKHLAEKILTSRSALEGERKQVTVLFADVKGSMELAEQVDPEEWHRILDRFFQILADGVHRFEGTINQYTGDGIMALFGAPIAHEDHPQRACYAALQLQGDLSKHARELKRERGLTLSTRIGLHSGDVVVGKIGDDLRMDYTAQGHTVGLAARMQELASPDTVYLTESTASRLSGFFELEDLGPFNVKGVSTPVEVFELRGLGPLRTRFDVSRARGLTRFVGRDADMQALEAALEQSLAGNGQVVGIVAEAGTGKSRLCFEFAERSRARGLRVLEAQGVAHGKNVPLLPVLQVCRAYYGITEQDDERTAREKIAGRLLLLDEEFREVLPLLFEFLGVADPERPAPRLDPEVRQRQLFGILRRLVQSGRPESPTVTLIEDLHWIDGASESWLAEWVGAIAGSPALLLVNFRPEYHAEWMQKSYYRQIPLAPLGPEAIRELLDGLLGSNASVEDLTEMIHERTGGNPFFIEEIVQSLIESGHLEGTRGRYRLVTPVERLEIPATVTSLLSARIDRLPEREKHVLQAAAVIGQEFDEPILEAVVELPKPDLGGALEALKASELVYEQSLYPVAEYAFKHALTQQVALESQLHERRRRTHAAVARAIEEAYPGQLDEKSALIAHHWEDAGEALEATRWHSRAAEWAGTSHLAEALRHWRKVRTLLEQIPESAETTALGVTACIQMLTLGWRLGASEDEAAAIFAEGKALAERSGDLHALARLVLMDGVARGLGGDLETILNSAIEAARLADQTDDAGLKAACRVNQIVAHYYAGRLSEALRSAEELLARTPDDPTLGADILGSSPHTFALFLRGRLATAMGRHNEAEKDLDRTIELARQQGDAEVQGWAHSDSVWLAKNTGRPGAALGHARHAVEIAERIGSSFSRVTAYRSLGLAHILTEEWGEAAGVLDRALEITRKTRVFLVAEASLLVPLAEAYLGLGEDSRARATADEAVAVARPRGTKLFECDAHLTRARVLLRTEGATASGDIQSALREAQALVEETGGRSREPLIHEERADLARLTGDDATHQRELREAHRLFTEMGATGHAERVGRELEESGD